MRNQCRFGIAAAVVISCAMVSPNGVTGVAPSFAQTTPEASRLQSDIDKMQRDIQERGRAIQQRAYDQQAESERNERERSQRLLRESETPRRGDSILLNPPPQPQYNGNQNYNSMPNGVQPNGIIVINPNQTQPKITWVEPVIVGLDHGAILLRGQFEVPPGPKCQLEQWQDQNAQRFQRWNCS